MSKEGFSLSEIIFDVMGSEDNKPLVRVRHGDWSVTVTSTDARDFAVALIHAACSANERCAEKDRAQ